MRSVFAAFVALLAVTAFAQDSSVTIPLEQYQELARSKENASATVVDTMTLGGTFKDRNLTITFAGRSVGTRTPTPIISEASDVTLSGCSGDALMTRGGGRGAYQIIALAPSFTLRCDARLTGSDRLPMTVQPAVLAIRSNVADGELVSGEERDDGARDYTLVRQVVGTNETLAATATGRYLITLLPDATRFHYVIQVHNPNRSTSPLPLHLVSGEHLQQIDSSAPYEVKDGSYVFAMPPGDSTITLNGELKGTTFAPPVEASLQYAVIESHPLLRPALQSAPKRVSTGETGIATQYRGALAFELGANQAISWTVTRLEALRAISYAVRNVSHTLFIPAKGPILGESEFQLDNQGAPELVLPPKPEPTFVSLQNEPVLMTKNAAGALTVPLSAGQQKVLVQYRQSAPQFGLLVGTLEVPRVPVPATNTQVNLRYPEHWLPLWQSFASEATVWTPDTSELASFLLLAIWLERVLAFLGLKTRDRIAIALLLGFASRIVPALYWLSILGCGFVTLVWIAAHRPKWTPARIVGAVAATVLVLLIAAAIMVSPMRKSSDYESSPAMSSVTDTATGIARDQAAPAAPPIPKVQRIDDLSYQGLPAKFELPSGARFAEFHEQLLAAERPQTITIVLLSMTLVTWLSLAMTIVAFWMLWLQRATIKSALRERIADAMTPVAPATA